MFSLIRKISSQQHKDNMTEDAKTDVDDKQEDQQQQEEVDGKSYDPHADPRDPGSYYTFPHFADDKQEDTTQQSPGTPQEDKQVDRQDPGPSDQDRDHSSSDSTTQTTPLPKFTSPSSPDDTTSPPFWPTSPLPKRLRSKSSSSPSPPSLQKRSTTSSPSSPQLSRIQPCRRATGIVTTQHNSPKLLSSPAARSLRSISAAQSPTRRPQQQQRNGSVTQGSGKLQQQRRGSAHSQGSPKRDGGKIG